MLENPVLLDIHIRGNRGEKLEGMESSQYHLMLRMAFEGHQTYFVQQAQGLVGEEIWSYWSRSMDVFWKNPGVENWWARSSSKFYSSFQTYINCKIEAGNLE